MLAITLVLVLLSAAACSGSQADLPPTQPEEEVSGLNTVSEDPPDWKTVESLISEQKYERAAKVVAVIREKARRNRKNKEWTKTLVKETQLRMALHGYETAVRFLKDEPWPDHALSQTTLNLFYAHALMTYIDGYSWEINQREKIQSSEEVDLKAWTREEIFAEALSAYVGVWNQREVLGEEPVSILSEYLNPNSYPKEVRGTLRDAASYMFVELLANTSNWRPEQSNELYGLNLAELIEGNLKISREVKLDDPSVHPLVKICAILDDLEAWSSKSKRKSAALEARLERLRRLRASFTVDQDRDRIREDLETRLPQFRSIAWWAQGIAQLAEFVRHEGDPNCLVRALAIAVQGLEAYPSSIGGQHCRNIVKTIEAPGYSATTMKSDGLAKRSIEIRHKNLSTIYFRAYRIDLIKWIKKARDWNLLPDNNEIQRIVQREEIVARWEVELPPTPDYREHRTFSVPALQDHGFYIIISSARGDFETDNNNLYALPMILTDIVLVSRPDGFGGQEVRVVSGRSGKPIVGAEVSLYQRDWKKGHHNIEILTSNGDGLVHFLSKNHDRSHNNFIIAEFDGDIALDDANIRFRSPSEPGETTASLVYTDRSVYRPMQKIFWKVLVYRGRSNLGRFQTFPDAAVTMSLVDPNHQTVETKVVATNEFGSASGEFTIPPGRPLGSWRIQSSLSGRQQIRVEEYKRPTFEAAFKDPTDPLRLNKPATMVGEVLYYFGLPVVNGTVNWRVTREPVYPGWWGWWWGRSGRSTQAQTIAVGVSSLDEKGNFEVSFLPEADERLAETSKETTYRFILTADVTDEGGETRTATRSFRLGFVTIEANVDLTQGFVRDDHRPELSIRRADLNGIPRSGEGTWRLFTLRQPEKTILPADEPKPTHRPDQSGKMEEAYFTPGDGLRLRWEGRYRPEQTMFGWTNGEELENGSIVHDESGFATVTLKALPAGAYRLTYNSVDDFGASFETSKEFVVAGEGSLALPALLLAESSSVPVGGIVRLLALSGLPDQLLFLDIFRAGKIVERRILKSGVDETLIEIPVVEEDRGGFGITLTAVRDHQFIQFSQAIFVPWDNKRLQVSFATFRDKIRPGTKETWRVTVTGPDGSSAEAGAVELLAYMYDKSLDIFAPHSPPNPLSLYRSSTQSGYSRANLGAMRGRRFIGDGFDYIPGYPSLQGDRLQFYSGYGIGGPGRRGRFAGAPMPMSGADESVLAFKSANLAVRGGRQHDLGEISDLASGESATLFGDEVSVSAVQPSGEIPEVALRSDFAETAFWEPHLLVSKDGDVSIEFEVPDPLTTWSVWIHAVTRDLKAGSLQRETRSVKELMVRPYVPRFLREGDEAQVVAVVNNASEEKMEGTLFFDILDPETDQSILSDFSIEGKDQFARPFEVGPGGSTSLTFDITAPKKVGIVAFKVVAEAGNLSDGELRPIPILPSRIHLAQSRFVTLRNADRRVLRFDDLAENEDPTLLNEQMVVTVDAQLFYTVLQALPYLVNYPYECTEQTLNRFVSTGIVSTLYHEFPAIARMAEEFSKRETRLETFDETDPNRRMTLEESPWLETAKGGRGKDLTNVLDPRIAKAERDVAIAKLRKAQTSLGGFPWFPGGPPSPYMTLYIMHGFAKAMEFGVEVPDDMVRRGWSYLKKHYHDKVRKMMADDCCWEFLTFLNYVASCYSDVSWTGDMLTLSEREEILDFSFKHWKHHSPFLKGYLALTLKRMNRETDAHLVWESVMDAAKTTDDLGTYWAQEDRSWLWYNDTIETHAFALRTLTELAPTDPHRDGLVQWLLLNKKLNQWKSTRATSEVIYSLIHYLKAEGALGITEDATVTVGNQKVTFTFEPDEYTGKKNQIIIKGDKVGPETATIVVEKQSKGFAFASATWHFSTEKLPEEDRGDFFSVSRTYFKRENTGREFVLTPLDEGAKIHIGDEIEIHISLRSKHRAEYVHLRDPRAAGLEPENVVSRHKWNLGIGWYEETRDSGSNFFFESLPAGEYTFKYRLRANMAGTFRVGPATVQSMYAPEFNAYSSGERIKISGAE